MVPVVNFLFSQEIKCMARLKRERAMELEDGIVNNFDFKLVYAWVSLVSTKTGTFLFCLF